MRAGANTVSIWALPLAILAAACLLIVADPGGFDLAHTRARIRRLSARQTAALRRHRRPSRQNPRCGCGKRRAFRALAMAAHSAGEAYGRTQDRRRVGRRPRHAARHARSVRDAGAIPARHAADRGPAHGAREAAVAGRRACGGAVFRSDRHIFYARRRRPRTVAQSRTGLHGHSQAVGDDSRVCDGSGRLATLRKRRRGRRRAQSPPRPRRQNAKRADALSPERRSGAVARCGSACGF